MKICKDNLSKKNIKIGPTKIYSINKSLQNLFSFSAFRSFPLQKNTSNDSFIIGWAERHGQNLLYLYSNVQLLLFRHLSDNRQQREEKHLVVVVLIEGNALAAVRGEDVVYLIVEGREGRLAELFRITRAHLVRGGTRLKILPATCYGGTAMTKGYFVLLDHGVVHFALAFL